MRNSTDSKFPYKLPTMCYFEVSGSGKVKQLPHKNKSDRPLVAAAYKRAKKGETKLFAVWPGDWSSDLFDIDDLDAFAAALLP